jgi:hypothetical protein
MEIYLSQIGKALKRPILRWRMFRKFKFEEEIYSDLRGIPLSTQFKLDAIGVRIRIETWNRLSQEARLLFCQIPAKTDQDKECYRNYLLYLLKRKRRQVHLLEPAQLEKERAEWENPGQIPMGVYKMVVDAGFTLSPQDWLELDEFKRYVLAKLSRENHNRIYLGAALNELLPTPAKIPSWKKKTAAPEFSTERLASTANA